MAGAFPNDFPKLAAITAFTKLFNQDAFGDWYITAGDLRDWLNTEGISIAISEDPDNALIELPDGFYVEEFAETLFDADSDETITITPGGVEGHNPNIAARISPKTTNLLKKSTDGGIEGLLVESAKVIIEIPPGTETLNWQKSVWEKVGAVPNIRYYKEDGTELNIAPHKFDIFPAPTECDLDFGSSGASFKIYALLS